MDGGDDPKKEIRLVPGAQEEAKEFLKKYPETRLRFDRVSKLVDGFESSFGLELLATVHWIIKHEQTINSDEVIEKIHNWSKHKQKFTQRQIIIAQNVLEKNLWLPTSNSI